MPDPETAPLRITHVTEAAGAGVWRHLQYVAPALAERGFTVDLVLSPRRADPDFDAGLHALKSAGCAATFLPLPRACNPFADWRGVRRLRRLIGGDGTRILHCHATKAGLIGRLAARTVADTKVVYSPHAFVFQGGRRACGRGLAVGLERWLARYTDRFVFVSEAERNVARDFLAIRNEHSVVAENALPEDVESALVDRRAARNRLGIGPDATVVAVPGRLARQKGQRCVLRAAAMLERSGNVRICFCGTGKDERSLRRLAARLGVDGMISWLGYVPELSRYLRAFDVIVLPSHYEGLSYLLLESLAAGVPLVVSDIPAHFPRAEMRQRLPCFAPDDGPALAGALHEVLHAPERRRALGEWAPGFVKREFSLAKQVDTLATCYRELAAAGGPGCGGC